ncbi:MAG TPA: sulfotransferase [Bacteroidales bacterium]|nr:sulfotransferase [Bacteroidales bacterium]
MTKQPSLRVQRTSMLNVINGTGYALRRLNMDPFKIDADAIIIKAKKKAGFNGSIPKAEEGLRKLTDSILKDGHPNPFGALAVKGLLGRILFGRYKIEQEMARNPWIEDQEIREPVFIIGMPRTGTTILHAILHKDPAHRAPLAWECLLPYPAATPDTFTDNEQLRTIEKEFNQLFKLVPDFRKKHYMEADSPQECLGITAFDFNSFQFSAQLYLKSYMDWFSNDSDMLGTMRFHKRFLQYLQSGGVKGERWLLKSPVHLRRLPEIFEVYPDARIIMTHRGPADIVSSTASLISSVRTLYSDNEDPNITGREQAELWSDYFNRFIDSRSKLDKEDQIIDLRFDHFVEDQIGTIEKIYKRFDWELSDVARSNFIGFLADNPRNKHGRHEYSLKDFGLHENEVNEKFRKYMEFYQQL